MLKTQKKVYRIAIAGNPNSGKTTIFNLLTGTRQHTGNWPGVTVEKKEGYFEIDSFRIEVVDLPGTYGLGAYTIDEKIARDFLINGQLDAVLVVVDALNLERNLLLLLQIMNLHVPILLALNMMDEAEKAGKIINVKLLSRLLGIPVIPTIAIKGQGIDELKKAILKTLKNPGYPRTPRLSGKMGEAIRFVKEFLLLHPGITRNIPVDWLSQRIIIGEEEYLKILETTKEGKKLKEFLENDIWPELKKTYGEDLGTALIEVTYGYINGIIKKVVKTKTTLQKRIEFSEKLDKFALNPLTGVPLFLIIMALTFELTFVLSKPFVYVIELFFDYLSRGLWYLLKLTHIPHFVGSFLVDGLLSGFSAVLTFVPTIFLLFGAIAFFEDSGYMARAAFVMDRLMTFLGLSGKAFIPMILGFGCNVPAIMATRILEDEKERLLTIMVIPLMSCSARLPIYTLFASVFFKNNPGLVVFSLYFLGILLAFLVIKVFNRVFFKMTTPTFVMELPPYRLPKFRNVFTMMWLRGTIFVKKAGSIIVTTVVVIWLLASLPPGVEYASPSSIIAKIGQIIAPLLKPAGFPNPAVAVALISGILAKEVVVSTLGALLGAGTAAGLQMALKSIFTPLSAYAFLVMSLIYIPCTATIAAIKAETGSWKWPLVTAVYTLILGYILSVIVYQAGILLGLG